MIQKQYCYITITNVGCVPQNTTHCNKTIISSKLFSVKYYFNYVINVILLTSDL